MGQDKAGQCGRCPEIDEDEIKTKLLNTPGVPWFLINEPAAVAGQGTFTQTCLQNLPHSQRGPTTHQSQQSIAPT